MKECPARVSQCAENYLKTNFTFTRVSQHNCAIYRPFISSAGVATYEKHFNAFKELGSKLANLKPGLANVCSPLFYCEGLSCEVHLINCLRVALNFSQGQVSANRCNLMCGAARFR